MTTQTAADAIRESIQTTSIVTVRLDADEESVLSMESDDSAASGVVTEYWGTDENGSEWRVHVERAS